MKRSERGYVLIMALLVTAAMTLLGLTAMQTVFIDLNTAGNDRASNLALYAAEAGIEYGMAQLKFAPYLFVSGGANDFDAILDNATTPAIDDPADTVCGGSSCKIWGWHKLYPGTNGIGYPNASDGPAFFRVAVQDDDDGDGDLTTDANQTVLMRSYGVAGAGGRRVGRMVEIKLTTNP